MTRYRLGVEAEREARKVLEAKGYLVLRSAASKGPFDLVALHPDGVLCVQVRRNSARFTPEEQKTMMGALGHMPECAHAELWTRHPGGRWEVVQLGLGLMGRGRKAKATDDATPVPPRNAKDGTESDGA